MAIFQYVMILDLLQKALVFSFLQIISDELSDLTSWGCMAIIPLFGMELEKLCNVGLILLCEGWVQYWGSTILAMQYWELNELDLFLKELDWFPDTLVISFSLLPLAWTVFFLEFEVVSLVWLSSHYKLILLAIWENGTFLCVFIVPRFIVSAMLTFAMGDNRQFRQWQVPGWFHFSNITGQYLGQRCMKMHCRGLFWLYFMHCIWRSSCCSTNYILKITCYSCIFKNVFNITGRGWSIHLGL